MTKKPSRETVYCEHGYGQNIGHFDTCPKEDVYIISRKCHNPNPDNFYTGWDCVYEILKVDESNLPIEELREFFISDLTNSFLEWKKRNYYTEGEIDWVRAKDEIKKNFIKEASSEEIRLLYYIAKFLTNIKYLPAPFKFENDKLTFIIDDYHRNYETLIKVARHLTIFHEDLGLTKLKIFFKLPLEILIEYEYGKIMQELILHNIKDEEVKKMFRELVYDYSLRPKALNNAELFLSGKIKDPRNWSDVAKLIARRFPNIEVRKIENLTEYFNRTHFLIVHYDPIRTLPIVVYPIKCYNAGEWGSPDPCKLYKKRLREDFCGDEWNAYDRFVELAKGLGYKCGDFKNWYNSIPGKLKRVCPKDIQEVEKYLGKIGDLPVLIYK